MELRIARELFVQSRCLQEHSGSEWDERRALNAPAAVLRARQALRARVRTGLPVFPPAPLNYEFREAHRV